MEVEKAKLRLADRESSTQWEIKSPLAQGGASARDLPNEDNLVVCDYQDGSPKKNAAREPAGIVDQAVAEKSTSSKRSQMDLDRKSGDKSGFWMPIDEGKPDLVQEPGIVE